MCYPITFHCFAYCVLSTITRRNIWVREHTPTTTHHRTTHDWINSSSSSSWSGRQRHWKVGQNKEKMCSNKSLCHLFVALNVFTAAILVQSHNNSTSSFYYTRFNGGPKHRGRLEDDVQLERMLRDILGGLNTSSTSSSRSSSTSRQKRESRFIHYDYSDNAVNVRFSLSYSVHRHWDTQLNKKGRQATETLTETMQTDHSLTGHGQKNTERSKTHYSCHWFCFAGGVSCANSKTHH